ncbi:MAG: cyclic nucleotide-binding domain-containing protein [Proteobacteria bacterium]|nr:cyclic nucleotide-binding domain-containing protein [Pseudomonadota bacterium]
MASGVDVGILRTLSPLSSLSDLRLQELAALCYFERVSKNVNPFRMRGIAGQSVFLVRGELELAAGDAAARKVIAGGTEEARYALGKRGPEFGSANAITDVELIRIDDDLLDIMVTWDQLAEGGQPARCEKDEHTPPSIANWSILSGMFSVNNLKFGAFSQLPAAHIDALLQRFERLEASRGQVIIREGAEGDYYYVIESGKCQVERTIGGVAMTLAEIKSGDAFGEEALVSDAKRNATVSMKTDGVLLRLDKQDFMSLLKEPLLQRISMEEGGEKVLSGAQWVDVRYPSEYQYDRLPGAINIPLAEIRNAFGVLDKGREYLLYCQSERRSSAAAFLLAQRGYRAHLLSGGLWGGRK